MDTQIIVALIGLGVVLLGGNSIVQVFITRHYTKHDKIEKLCKMNDRQAKDLVVLSTTMEAVLDVQELIVEALHDKQILNGNAKPIKTGIQSAKKTLHQYTKEVKDNGLFIGDTQ